MARMKFNRFTECESGATILTEWLNLPHLEQQLIRNKLNTGAMYNMLFNRIEGQNKLPRKYRHNGKSCHKSDQDGRIEQNPEIIPVGAVKMPDNEFSDFATGDFTTVGQEVLELVKIEETMNKKTI